MICQRCEEEASIHLTELIDGRRHEFHLCAPCARKAGLILPESPPELALDAVVQGLIVAHVGELVGELAELTCPDCGNDRNFLVKTLQMHVVNVEGGRVEVSEETRPAVLEVLCDECESALKFDEFEDTLRKEVLLTIGAR